MSDSHYNIITKCNNHLECISKIDGYCIHSGYCVFKYPFKQVDVINYLKKLPENSKQMIELYDHLYEFMWFLDDEVIELKNNKHDVLIPVHRKHWHNIKIINI